MATKKVKSGRPAPAKSKDQWTRFGVMPAHAAKIKRIGVLTGGGDCPGLNAVIRAVVKTSITVYGWEVIGFEDGFEGMIMPGKNRSLDMAAVRGILHTGGTILGSTNRGNPFNFPVQRGSKLVPTDCSPQVVETYKRFELDALIAIGGDGSLKIAHRFQKEKGLKVVGVPKTIDNDLCATDQTFGFDTAVATATGAIDKLHTTAESHHRIMFVEVMGRDAGWIALHAGLAGGADVILIPEMPYDIKRMVEKIRQREEAGSKSSIVVVAEGAKPVGGEVASVRSPFPPFDLVRLGGAAQRVADEIEKLTGKETRVTVLGHIQRGGSPTNFDRNLGTRFGVAAAQTVARGEFGSMVALRGTDVVNVRLEDAINRQKFVDPKGEIVLAARATGVSFCAP
jgi:ATP-dependent phosphofructokinase / diphosphate-dependent phosphofructokinase